MSDNLSNIFFNGGKNPIYDFANLLKTGFQNPEGITGSVKVHIPEHPDQSFIARYSDELHIEPCEALQETDTLVSIPMATMERIATDFEFLDWRDPEIIGTITFEGNLNLANHLAKSCQRPTDVTTALFQRVGKLHREKGYSNLTEVERLNCPTQMQVLERIEAGCPTIITGLEPSSSSGNWSLDKLAERYGVAVVRVRSATQRQTMREFVEELQAFEQNPYEEMVEGFVKPYTEGASLPEAMWADFGPLFFDREDFTPPQLWLGSVPTNIPTSSLHRDPQTGFLLQVMGQKRLDLYSADQEALLYPHKAYNNYQPCWFKPEVPDYGLYPEAEKAKCISVTLNPGELLLQPAGWFHQVYALDSPNMSVSYFWRY
ncbi:cupin-like domain-containing protein [Leucothrix pacifica]|uniref:JmjC domain-containing protein n=1 Tax=Leucothrix pacifica TaxID=1247513 RepID=A0A317C3M9_9GAMM|nr:cupin-like domain-containing protein [Leucothrix pacifica]PWQ93255.1 hypothetical protein DKW60_18095 [Leucothrix pacifica]